VLYYPYDKQTPEERGSKDGKSKNMQPKRMKNVGKRRGIFLRLYEWEFQNTVLNLLTNKLM